VERNRRSCNLNGCVRGKAEGAIGVRDIPVRVNVDSLNRANGQDQSNANQGEQKSPWAVQTRF
jgi:hypothetical protein